MELSHAVLPVHVPLKSSTCPYQRSLLSLSICGQSPQASSSLDLSDHLFWLDIPDLSDHGPVGAIFEQLRKGTTELDPRTIPVKFDEIKPSGLGDVV